MPRVFYEYEEEDLKCFDSNTLNQYSNSTLNFKNVLFITILIQINYQKYKLQHEKTLSS
jgi:hypothetical protein